MLDEFLSEIEMADWTDDGCADAGDGDGEGVDDKRDDRDDREGGIDILQR
jgi:hypothetical protein